MDNEANQDKEFQSQWVQFLTPHWILPNGICFVVSLSIKEEAIAFQIEGFIQFKKFRRDCQRTFIFET